LRVDRVEVARGHDRYAPEYQSAYRGHVLPVMKQNGTAKKRFGFYNSDLLLRPTEEVATQISSEHHAFVQTTPARRLTCYSASLELRREYPK
jgi:hypothetical protein